MTTGVIRLPPGVERDTFNTVVSAAYTAYLTVRKTPTVDQIASFTKITKKTIAKIIDTSEFKTVIKERGVNWTEERGLSAKQMLALTVMTNPSDRRNVKQKLNSIGATYAEYQAWLKQPLFRDRVDKLAEEMLGDNMGTVHQALLNQATGGNVRAIELYYQMTGRHDPAAKQVVEMQNIIKMLLEVLTKRITDRDLLDVIAGDIVNEVMPKLTMRS